jgi:hypothetical protein
MVGRTAGQDFVEGDRMKKLLYVTLALFVLALVVSPVVMMAQEKAPTTTILKGSPMGGVKFDHAAHVKAAGGDAKCDTCHHASKPEKANTTAHQKCQDCHTKVATAPMKTKTQAAFHDPMAKKGTCVDCHVKNAAAAKKPPSKCNECHKKENV